MPTAGEYLGPGPRTSGPGPRGGLASPGGTRRSCSALGQPGMVRSQGRENFQNQETPLRPWMRKTPTRNSPGFGVLSGGGAAQPGRSDSGGPIRGCSQETWCPQAPPTQRPCTQPSTGEGTCFSSNHPPPGWMLLEATCSGHPIRSVTPVGGWGLRAMVGGRPLSPRPCQAPL